MRVSKLGLLLAASGSLWGQAYFNPTVPQAPAATVDASVPTRTGALTAVHAGANLQTAINAAACGDWLVLDAGAEFTGNFTLPNKGCDSAHWVVITTSGTLPAYGTRIAPANLAQMATISTSNSTYPIKALLGAAYYRIMGIEFKLATGNTGAYYMVCMGASCDGVTNQTDANRPNHLILDRVYIHGDGNFAHSVQHAVALQCDSCGVVESYISGIWGTLSTDSQAIFSTDGRGPFIIRNNYLQAASENVDFGGAMPTLTGVIPSDLTMTGNYVTKDVTWVGHSLNIKNLFEAKSLQRASISGNIFENCPAEGQTGTALMLTVRTGQSGSWAVVNDLLFSNNIIRHAGGGWETTGYDTSDPNYTVSPSHTQRIMFLNNLWYDITSAAPWNGNGRWGQIFSHTTDVTVVHNTGGASTAMLVVSPGDLSSNIFFQDNALGFGTYGIFSSSGQGRLAFNSLAGPWYYSNNGMYNFDNSQTANYPTGNFYLTGTTTMQASDAANATPNWYFLDTSPWHSKAHDGTDLGSNLVTLNPAVSAATTGTAPACYAVLGSTGVTPGGSSTLYLSLITTGSYTPASFGFDIGFPPSKLSSLSGAAAGTAFTAGKTATCALTSTSNYRCTVGGNANAIANGLVASVTLNNSMAAQQQATVFLNNLSTADASSGVIGSCFTNSLAFVSTATGGSVLSGVGAATGIGRVQ